MILKICSVLNTNHERREGFSLIEVSFALLIVGIIAASTLNGYNLYIKNKQQSDTAFALSEINRALQDHVSEFGFYPCPSDQSVPRGAANYGKEVSCSGTNLLSIPVCSGVGQGICRTSTSPVVIIGGVPFTKLHLSEGKSYDAWKKRITYALTADLRPRTPVLSSLTGKITVEKTDATNATISDAHYVLVSHGEKGIGAFNKSGFIAEACDFSKLEGENCDQDATFISDFGGRWRSVADNANYFDDFVRYAQKINVREWNVEAATPNDLRFSYDRVGIGIADASDETDLHVVGNILVEDWVKTDHLCSGERHKKDAHCFDPEAIAGDKTSMRCDAVDNNPGEQAVVGISNSSVRCKLAVKPTAITPAPCPTGYLAVGFKANGQLDCKLF